MGSRIVAFAPLAGAVFVIACVGDSPDSSPADAGSPPADSGASSSSGNASSSSGGATDTGVDAPTPRFCETNKGKAFCADFDDATSIAMAGWDMTPTGGGGLIELVAKAAHATIPQTTGADESTFALLKRNDVPLGTSHHVIFEYKLKTPPVVLSTGQVIVYSNVAVNGGAVALLQGPGGWYIGINRVDTTDASSPFGTVPQAGVLSKVVMDITFSPTAGHVKTTVDDNLTYDQNIQTMQTGSALPTSISVFVGVKQQAGHTPAAETTYDDVLLTIVQ